MYIYIYNIHIHMYMNMYIYIYRTLIKCGVYNLFIWFFVWVIQQEELGSMSKPQSLYHHGNIVEKHLGFAEVDSLWKNGLADITPWIFTSETMENPQFYQGFTMVLPKTPQARPGAHIREPGRVPVPASHGGPSVNGIVRMDNI